MRVIKAYQVSRYVSVVSPSSQKDCLGVTDSDEAEMLAKLDEVQRKVGCAV